MDAYGLFAIAMLLLCGCVIIYLLIKLSKTKKNIEQVASDNLKRGREEAADFVRCTMDKVQDDKNKLNEMSDRELLIETMLALAGYGRRLDRIEEKIQGVYNYKAYTEGLAKQIKSISDLAIELTEGISSSAKVVVDFKKLVEATRQDVDKVNSSISNIKGIEEKISSHIININNSMGELALLNNKLEQIESKIQGIYEYKKYLDEIVEQVGIIKQLSKALATNIVDNDNNVKSFNLTVQHACSDVNKLNYSLADVDNLNTRINTVVENMNKATYEMSYLRDKITEIVTVTNGVIQTYGNAPMVKLTNIEDNIDKVKDILYKTLDDEYEYDSIYSKIREVVDEISSFENEIEDVKSTIDSINQTLSDKYGYDSICSMIHNMESGISSFEYKIEDVKSAINNLEYEVRGVKDSVDNIKNEY